MKIGSGLKRLWVVGTLILVAISLLSSFGERNLEGQGAIPWSCFPGTGISATEKIQVGKEEPSQDEIRRAIKEKPDYFVNNNDGTYSLIKDLKPIYKEEKTYRCTTYGHLFTNAIIALLISGIIILLFWACFWVIQGFRES